MKEPVDGNIAGNDCGDQDHKDHKHASKVLDPAIPISKPFRRFPAGQHEREQERDCGDGIPEIVDRIGEQCNAAGIIYDDYLKDRGDEQTDKGPLDRPDSPLGCED